MDKPFYTYTYLAISGVGIILFVLLIVYVFEYSVYLFVRNLLGKEIQPNWVFKNYDRIISGILFLSMTALLLHFLLFDKITELFQGWFEGFVLMLLYGNCGYRFIHSLKSRGE
ncbi:MAG TPA: hypothetical protein PK878_04895 [bacterium]|nr:hypothetical protein [bacterium]HOL94229.1 hypothetical protein [bacterium]HPP01311.1 hypothetical protein [bacterium]HXK92610.1 hypothetical protein [bacterium]